LNVIIFIGSGFLYEVVLCGNLTILNIRNFFYCLLIIDNKKSLCHSLGRPSRSDFVQSQFMEDTMKETFTKPAVSAIIEKTETARNIF
jgi:hypothetical protein